MWRVRDVLEKVKTLKLTVEDPVVLHLRGPLSEVS